MNHIVRLEIFAHIIKESKVSKSKWTIKEEKDNTTWWMIRGGAFSNVINNKYPNRLFDEREDAEMISNDSNRLYDRNTEIVEVEFKNVKAY